MPEKDALIYVAGHTGLVGSAIARELREQGFRNLLLVSHGELDLRNQAAVRDFFADNRPEYVYLAAGKVGGIHANDVYPAEFIYDNMLIAANVIDAAYRNGAKKLLYLGSSCIYPKFAKQPIQEVELLQGQLEPTNQWYALAKISGIKLAQAYRRQYGFDAISAMPCNLYGPGDNFDPQNSHVLPAMIRRFHEATLSGDSVVTIWGSGAPLREFLHSDDLADACVHLMENYSQEEHINIGSDREISILNLAKLVAEIVGFKGEIRTDPGKPDGAPRKLMDNSRLLEIGWQPKIGLREGISDLYKWYCENGVEKS